jgi:hypothetical protein
MLQKVSQVAEQVATRLSRRAFLGKAGKSALAVAGVLGGFLALPNDAHALGRRGCCWTVGFTSACAPKVVNGVCPATHPNPAACPQGFVPRC